MFLCIRLALSTEKSKLKVQILRHSKQILMTLFGKQLEIAIENFRSFEHTEMLLSLRSFCGGSEKSKFKVKILRNSNPNLTTFFTRQGDIAGRSFCKFPFQSQKSTRSSPHYISMVLLRSGGLSS